MPVRGTRRQGRPVLRAALPARAAVVDGRQHHVAEGAGRKNGPAAAPLPRAPAGSQALSTGSIPVAARSFSTARRAQRGRCAAATPVLPACESTNPRHVEGGLLRWASAVDSSFPVY